MLYRNYLRAKKMKSIFEKVAYGSLFLDFMVAFVTLVSLHYASFSHILFFLNIALSAVVVLSVVLFLMIFGISHYEKIIDGIAYLQFRARHKTK
ncbi:MAG: hypothetical protein ACP5MK_02615 [Candidatus Micrarchaeia archaeon]